LSNENHKGHPFPTYSVSSNTLRAEKR